MTVAPQFSHRIELLENNSNEVEPQLHNQISSSGTRPDTGNSITFEFIERASEMAKKAGTYKVGRDAGSGKFIPVKVAQQRKKTAVVETMKKSSSKKK